METKIKGKIMPTITERNGRFRVVIRKRENDISATFSDLETAQLWGKWKEKLIDEMHQFEFKPEQMITLGECIDLKIDDIRDKPEKEKSCYTQLITVFKEFIEIPICEISFDQILEKSNRMLDEKIKRGGSKKNPDSGIETIQSPYTVLRKMSYLSTVFEFIKKNGAEISNPVQLVISQMKAKLNKIGKE